MDWLPCIGQIPKKNIHKKISPAARLKETSLLKLNISTGGYYKFY